MWFNTGHLNHAKNKNTKWEQLHSHIIHCADICFLHWGNEIRVISYMLNRQNCSFNVEMLILKYGTISNKKKKQTKHEALQTNKRTFQSCRTWKHKNRTLTWVKTPYTDTLVQIMMYMNMVHQEEEIFYLYYGLW